MDLRFFSAVIERLWILCYEFVYVSWDPFCIAKNLVEYTSWYDWMNEYKLKCTSSYYMKEMYEVIYLSEKIHPVDGFSYPVLVINWCINSYISFVYANLYILIYIFSYIPLYLVIQHQYLETIQIGLNTFGATAKKSQVQKGRFPLEPQVRRNPQKTFENNRDAVSILTLYKFVYIAMPSKKADCTISVGWHIVNPLQKF